MRREREAFFLFYLNKSILAAAGARCESAGRAVRPLALGKTALPVPPWDARYTAFITLHKINSQLDSLM